MSWALVRKELREHGPVLLAAALLSGLALVGVMLTTDKSGGGRFTALTIFAPSMGALGALIAANRLFVREYAGRTQLFLEVLPVSRTRVFVTKWLLGALWTAGLLAAAWASVLNHQREREVIALADALPVLGAVVLFGIAVWSFAALAGMLGGLRYMAWIAAALGLGLAINAGQLSEDELPVFALLSDRVTMARGAADPRDIAVALGLSALFTAGAAALALIGSGAIASALARRMTTRERVFLLVSALVIAFVYSVIEGKRKKPAFELADATLVEGKHARIGLMATKDLGREQMLALCRKIAHDVDIAVEALGLSWLGARGEPIQPTVYVLPQQGLDKRLVERASLGLQDGIVLRAAPSVDEAVLRARVLHELISDASDQRASREDRHLLLDGFAEWLVLRGDPAERALSGLRFASIARPIAPVQLERWEESMEQLGPCTANALAFASADAVASALGEEGFFRLLRALFARQPADVRVLFEEPPSAQLARAGVPWRTIAARVEAERERLREERALELAAIPERTARIEVQRSPKRGVSVQGRVQGATAFRLLYSPLGPWTRMPASLARLDVRGADAAPEVSGTVPISLTKGSRVFAAIEVDESLLQCSRRLRAVRLVLP